MKVSLSLLWQKSFGGSAMRNMHYGCAIVSALCMILSAAIGSWGWLAFNMAAMLFNLYAAENTYRE